MPLTRSDVRLLEAEFLVSSNPQRAVLGRLASETNQSIQEIRRWFADRLLLQRSRAAVPQGIVAAPPQQENPQSTRPGPARQVARQVAQQTPQTVRAPVTRPRTVRAPATRPGRVRPATARAGPAQAPVTRRRAARSPVYQTLAGVQPGIFFGGRPANWRNPGPVVPQPVAPVPAAQPAQNGPVVAARGRSFSPPPAYQVNTVMGNDLQINMAPRELRNDWYGNYYYHPPIVNLVVPRPEVVYDPTLVADFHQQNDAEVEITAAQEEIYRRVLMRKLRCSRCEVSIMSVKCSSCHVGRCQTCLIDHIRIEQGVNIRCPECDHGPNPFEPINLSRII